MGRPLSVRVYTHCLTTRIQQCSGEEHHYKTGQLPLLLVTPSCFLSFFICFWSPFRTMMANDHIFL